MKSTRFVFGRALAVLCALLFVSFGFMSCQQEDETEYVNYSLTGTWQSSYGEIFKITSTSLSNGGSWGNSYAGNNLVVSYTNDAATSGYIYIKYTRAMNSDYTYSETAPDVGKWYAVAFKELTASSLSLSGAYNASGKTSAETLEEAISTFTIANGYFDNYSECVKQ
ncbi:hypothetical protein [uncultured Treponema sp.]|uniref:hypothetical protein n=1 Tax=uncultured Treponema sp. TaxID=162155 RepID=UPI0025F7173B|nr:hypothetical protein [uncultured Treponema sp.]